MYLEDGKVLRYKLREWSSEEVKLQAVEPILAAALSPDSQWLAFRDQEGVKLSSRPFDSVRIISGSNPIWGAQLAFSHDNRYLAYPDEEGLKVFDRLSGESRLISLHLTNTEPEELAYNRIYLPHRWSPDDRWLVVWVQGFEGYYLVLAHVPTGRLHDFTNCGEDLEWTIPSELVVGVSYSGWFGCGDSDGVYILSAGPNSFTETRIYYDRFPVDPWDRETRYVRWSPHKNWISFVQGSSMYQQGEAYDRLMVIRSDGSEARNLAISKGWIVTPVWLLDETRILTIIDDRELDASKIISVDVETLSQRDFGELDYSASIVAVSPGSEWILLSLSREPIPPSRMPRNLFYLMNVENGMGINVPETVDPIGGPSRAAFIAWE